MKSFELGGGNGSGEILLAGGSAEGDVFAQRQIEDDTVLKNEADLPVQRFLVCRYRPAGRRT